MEKLRLEWMRWGLSAKTAQLCSLPLDEDHVVLIRVSKVWTMWLVCIQYDALLQTAKFQTFGVP